MRHPSLVRFEAKLKEIFDEIDEALEKKYGGMYPRHPNRPPFGATSNREHDGLFNIGASFTAGYGSKYGRGYVIELKVATLSHVPEQVCREMENDAVGLLRKRLSERFPDRFLTVEEDGPVYKIYGDLSLGRLY